MRRQLESAKWEIVTNQYDHTIWEPYITTDEKRYNPFFAVYREMYEELPETNKISLFERVSIEMGLVPR